MDASELLALLTTHRVVPVLLIDEVADAVPLARALVAGGLPVLEVTLRTEAATESIRAIRQAVAGVTVGAGTVLDGEHIAQARHAGAVFCVSPGATPVLLQAARTQAMALIPGVATPSEAMQARAMGYRLLKLFPAEAAGGIALLGALGSTLPELRFMPTGGIAPENAAHYLRLDNVAAVAGTWIAPRTLIRERDWPAIQARAAAARALAG